MAVRVLRKKVKSVFRLKGQFNQSLIFASLVVVVVVGGLLYSFGRQSKMIDINEVAQQPNTPAGWRNIQEWDFATTGDMGSTGWSIVEPVKREKANGKKETVGQVIAGQSLSDGMLKLDSKKLANKNVYLYTQTFDYPYNAILFDQLEALAFEVTVKVGFGQSASPGPITSTVTGIVDDTQGSVDNKQLTGTVLKGGRLPESLQHVLRVALLSGNDFASTSVITADSVATLSTTDPTLVKYSFLITPSQLKKRSVHALRFAINPDGHPIASIAIERIAVSQRLTTHGPDVSTATSNIVVTGKVDIKQYGNDYACTLHSDQGLDYLLVPSGVAEKVQSNWQSIWDETVSPRPVVKRESYCKGYEQYLKIQRVRVRGYLDMRRHPRITDLPVLVSKSVEIVAR